MINSGDIGEMDEIDVYQINAGDGDGADILFDFNGQRIYLSFCPNPSFQLNRQDSCNSEILEDRIIRLLGRATVTEDMDEYETILDEVLEPILEARRATFREAASRNFPACGPNEKDLDSLLCPLALTFGLKAISGKVMINPIAASETCTVLEPTSDRGIEHDTVINRNGSQYSSKNVVILDTLEHGAGSAVSRVLVEGREVICRAQKDRLLDPTLEREVVALQKNSYVMLAKEATAVRHCLLREWVSGRSLSEIDLATTVVERRQEWALQIRQTVEQLHGIDVTWGDGKASNVVGDAEDQTWLIDFGDGLRNPPSVLQARDVDPLGMYGPRGRN